MAGRTEREIKNSEKNVLSLNSEQVLNLKQVTEEYKIKPDNPELLTKFMRSFWEEAGKRIGKDYVVTEFPLKSKEIKKRAIKGQMAIFVPAEVSRVDLGKMFPEMKTWAVQEGNDAVDIINNFGWLWIEVSVDAPNLKTTQGELENRFKNKKRQGQSLRSYIAGGQVSKILTDKYFDEGWRNDKDILFTTTSRLLGTRDDSILGYKGKKELKMGGILYAKFNQDGSLYVRAYWDPEPARANIGGRSEEVVKA